jgi:hypothetical protein
VAGLHGGGQFVDGPAQPSAPAAGDASAPRGAYGAEFTSGSPPPPALESARPSRGYDFQHAPATVTRSRLTGRSPCPGHVACPLRRPPDRSKVPPRDRTPGFMPRGRWVDGSRHGFQAVSAA